jgi:acyl transferase domain-containing protein
MREESLVLLEVGPGQVLSTLASSQRGGVECAVAASMPPVKEFGEQEAWLMAMGRLWVAGVELDWSAGYGQEPRRVHLPGYAFDRQRCWLEQGREKVDQSTVAVAEKDCDILRSCGAHVEDLILQQLKVMQEQLRALTGRKSGGVSGSK